MKNAGNVFSLNHFVEIRASMPVKTETSQLLCEVAHHKIASMFISHTKTLLQRKFILPICISFMYLPQLPIKAHP